MHRSARVDDASFGQPNQNINSKSETESKTSDSEEKSGSEIALTSSCSCYKQPRSITTKQSLTPQKSLSPENNPEQMPKIKQAKRKAWLHKPKN